MEVFTLTIIAYLKQKENHIFHFSNSTAVFHDLKNTGYCWLCIYRGVSRQCQVSSSMT